MILYKFSYKSHIQVFHHTGSYVGLGIPGIGGGGGDCTL